MTRRGPGGALALAVVVASVAVLAGVLAGCSGPAGFDERVGYRDIERTIARAGLEVCSVDRDPEGMANEATDSRVYEIAASCPSEDVVRLVVDRFDDEEARDGAARQFEVLSRPRGDGVVWTWGPMTLFATAEHDDAVMDRLSDALDEAGAQ